MGFKNQHYTGTLQDIRIKLNPCPQCYSDLSFLCLSGSCAPKTGSVICRPHIPTVQANASQREDNHNSHKKKSRDTTLFLWLLLTVVIKDYTFEQL